MIVDIEDRQVIVVPKDKKVSCVEYQDGTADISVDFDNYTLSYIYKMAAEWNCDFNTAAIRMIKEGLDLMELNEKNQSTMEEA